MPSLQYVHLDVFADRPFNGNQLAVFTEARNLDDREMQLIAREMAFSETTFVTDTDTEPHVRIFTPLRELPMAGHPTIGTIFALANLSKIPPRKESIIVRLAIGPTPFTLQWRDDQLAFAWMTQAAPTFKPMTADLGRLADALGVAAADVRDSGLPVEVVSSGVQFLIVPMVSREAVNRVVLERPTFQTLCESAGFPELPLFVFSTERGDDDATTFSRMLAPLFGIAEDPATGGAGGPLGGYLVRHRAISKDSGPVINLQGHAMGRPSRIHIAVVTDQSGVASVRVGGTSVVVGRGSLSF